MIHAAIAWLQLTGQPCFPIIDFSQFKPIQRIKADKAKRRICWLRKIANFRLTNEEKRKF